MKKMKMVKQLNMEKRNTSKVETKKNYETNWREKEKLM